MTGCRDGVGGVGMETVITPSRQYKKTLILFSLKDSGAPCSSNHPPIDNGNENTLLQQSSTS